MNKFPLFVLHKHDHPIGNIMLTDDGEMLLLGGVPVGLAPAYTLDEDGLPDKIIGISLVPLLPEVRDVGE